MFTEANTEGFSAQELAVLNSAATTLMLMGLDEKAALDAVNNAWQSGLEADQIIQRVANFGMVSGAT